MAAGEYLRSASVNLHQVANNLQQQAKGLQTTLTRLRPDKTTPADKGIFSARAARLRRMGASDFRSNKPSLLARRIEKLQREIMAAERELHKTEADLGLIDAAKSVGNSGIKVAGVRADQTAVGQ